MAQQVSTTFESIDAKIVEMKNGLKEKSSMLKKMKNRISVDFISIPDVTVDKIMQFYARNQDFSFSDDAKEISEKMTSMINKVKPSKKLYKYKEKFTSIKKKFNELLKLINQLKENNEQLGKEIQKKLETAKTQCDVLVNDLEDTMSWSSKLLKTSVTVESEMSICLEKEKLLEIINERQEEYAVHKRLITSAITHTEKCDIQLNALYSFVQSRHTYRTVPENGIQGDIQRFLNDLELSRQQLRQLTIIKSGNRNSSEKKAIEYFEEYKHDVNLLFTYYTDMTNIYKSGMLSLVKRIRKLSPESDKKLDDWTCLTLLLETISIVTKDVNTHRDILTDCQEILDPPEKFVSERMVVLEFANWELD